MRTDERRRKRVRRPSRWRKSSSVNTRSATDFWTELQATLTSIIGGGDGRSVVVDRHAGLVIVRAMPGELRDVEAYLDNAQDNLQRPGHPRSQGSRSRSQRQFPVGHRLGRDLPTAAISRSAIQGWYEVGGCSPTKPVRSTAPATWSSARRGFHQYPYANLFAVGSSSSTFGSLITLLSTQGNVHVLSSPRVSTVNNQKAVIKVGSDEYFVTEISSDRTSTARNTTSNPELTLTPFFSGIALDVTPQIGADGDVILHIHPSISESRINSRSSPWAVNPSSCRWRCRPCANRIRWSRRTTDRSSSSAA